MIAALRSLGLIALAMLAPATFAAEVAPPHEQALYLAGMELPRRSSLDDLGKRSAIKQHRQAFDAAWSRLETDQLAVIRQWAPAHIAPALESTDPLFYMFSGPDFLYAHTLFPKASTYIFCGIEPVGPLPQIESLKESTIPSALANLRKSVESALSFSFFITKDMKVDLKQTQLTGTVPVLYLFLARLGCHIDSAELVGLDDAGKFVAGDAVKHSGVKIVFAAAESSTPQTLYYFSSDLASWAIKQHPGFLRFCQQQGRGSALLKAASYLMHGGNFDTVRDFLLSHSRVLLQDDSGIPLERFSSDLWNFHHLGHYVGPIELFQEQYQSSLNRAYQALDTVEYLPFSFGYRWKPQESSMMLATDSNAIPRAIPLTDEQADEILKAMPR